MPALSARRLPRRLLKILNVSTRKPVIGIPADRRLLGHHYFHCVGEKYIRAVAEGAQAMPVLIPVAGRGARTCDELLADFDGILLTGSPSNVEPHHYSGPPSDPGTLHDAASGRDHAAADSARRRRPACRCWRSAAASRR